MSMDLIQTVTVGSGGAASIEFTSIPQDGTDLVVLVSLRTNKASGNPDAIAMRFNGDTAGNYTTRWLEGTGSAAQSGNTTTGRIYGEHLGQHAAYTSNTFGNASFYVANYTSSSSKSLSIDGVTENNATGSYQVLAAAVWNNSNAITSLAITGDGNDLLQHSTASLYKVTKGSDGIVTTS